MKEEFPNGGSFTLTYTPTTSSSLGLAATATERRNVPRRLPLSNASAAPVGLFVRLLRVDGEEVRPRDFDRISAILGTDQWRAIYEARIREELQPAEARVEYVNFMRWRLERDLGYAKTHPFEVHKERGRSIHHPHLRHRPSCWDEIMSHLYGRARLFGAFPRSP